MKATLVAFALSAPISVAALSPDMRPADIVDVQTIVPGLRTDIRYAGAHNFTGAPVDGYEAPRCLLTKAAAAALAHVQASIARDGLGLKVFDCYRPARAVRRFVEWAQTPGADSGKREFFPDVDKKDLFRFGYIAERSSHSRGSTLDVTLVDRASGQELDMGTPFDFFGPQSHPDYPVVPAAKARRLRLAEAMRAGGFLPYAQEWWHFTLENEPYPGTAFDFPVR